MMYLTFRMKAGMWAGRQTGGRARQTGPAWEVIDERDRGGNVSEIMIYVSM